MTLVSFRSVPLTRVTEIQQHLGDAGHAGAADADEVDVADAAHALVHRRASASVDARVGDLVRRRRASLARARPRPSRSSAVEIAEAAREQRARAPAASSSRSAIASPAPSRRVMARVHASDGRRSRPRTARGSRRRRRSRARRACWRPRARRRDRPTVAPRAMSSTNSSTRASTPAAAYAARASSTPSRPAWCQTSGRRSGGSSASASGSVSIQDARALAAADDEQAAPRAVARGEPLARRIARRDRVAHGIADDLGARATPGSVSGKRFEDLRGERREPAIRRAGHGVLLVQHERPAREPGRDAAGARDESAHAEHGGGLAPAQRSERLRDGGDDAKRRASARRRAPRPRTPAIVIHSISMPCCGTTRASMPRCVPSQTTSRCARARALRDGEAREHVPARAARHDHDRAAAHRTYPRCTSRFWPPYSSW